MRVLFVGATGRVGRDIVPQLAKQYDMTLVGHEDDEVAGLPARGADIRNFEETLTLVQESGADAVVNCAIADYRHARNNLFVDRKDRDAPDANRRHHYYESLHPYRENMIEVNVRGAYHLYEAAARVGISKFMYISSMTVLMGPPRYESITGSEMPRPLDFYACTKNLGEQTGSVYAARYNMSVTCLRLGQPYPFREDLKNLIADARIRGVLVHLDDVAQSVDRALRETASFTTYPIVSASDVSWVDEAAAQALGYVPRYRFTAEGPELREENKTSAP